MSEIYKNITSEPYLSGYTFRTLASQAICEHDDPIHMQKVCSGIDPDKVENNDLLYVTGNQSKDFLINIAPKIKTKFSMITSRTDPGVDHTYISLLPENLVTWWSINVHVDHPKIKKIPLGLQNLHWKWDGNIQSDPDTYKKYKTYTKTKNVLASFSIVNNIPERHTCYLHAQKINADFRMFHPTDRRNENYVDNYFEEASRYRFILAPWGAGIDCHRLWEAMYLGSIPITRRHRVYEDFEDYPILFLDDWSQLEDIDFESTYDHYKNKLETENRIYFDHWKDRILNGSSET